MRMKFFFAITVALWTFSVLKAQSPYIWAREGVNPPNPVSNNEGEAVAADRDGNVIATGYFTTTSTTFGSVTLNNPQSAARKIYIVKYDSTGNLLWAKSIAGESSSYGHAVAVDDTGNIYIAGGYSGGTSITFAPLTIANANDPKFFLAKYDPNGNALWVQSMGQQYTSFGSSVTVDHNSGAIYFAGSCFDTTVIFDTITVNNTFPGWQEVYLVRYTPSGHPLWVRHFGSNQTTTAAQVTTDTAGNIYLAGNFKGASMIIGTDTLLNAGSGTEDFYVTSFTANGNPIWSQRYGATGPDFAATLCEDNFGHLYLGGYYYSSSITLGANTFVNNGAPDALFTRLNSSDGTVTWSTAAGAANNDIILSACTDTLGHVFFTGGFDISAVPSTPYSISFGSTVISEMSNSEDPAFIIEMDSSLNIVHTVVLQTGGDDILAIAEDPSSSAIYISGDAQNNPWIFGPDTLFGGINTGEYIMTAKLNLENDALYITTGANNATDCTNPCSGSASCNVFGGTPPYTYLWLPGNQNTALATGLCAGTYTVIVTDQAGDSLVSTVNVAFISNGPVITLSVTPISCNGVCDGAYTINVTGGMPPYLISPWGNGTNLCPGNYPVMVMDANGCSSYDTAVLINPPVLALGTTITDASCSTCPDGILVGLPSGGTPPYSFNWQPGNLSNDTISGLLPGSYTCCVTDAHGCQTCDTSIVDFFDAVASVSPHFIAIYPNPVTTRLHVDAGGKWAVVRLYSASGQLLRETESSTAIEMDLTDIAAGLYLIEVLSEEQVFRQNLIRM